MLFHRIYRRFPGETEEDFLATLALVRQIGYAGAYSFKYSPRPGTPAADMRETVTTGLDKTAVMDERLARLQDLIDSQQAAFNKAAIGKTVDVLFERAARNPGQIVGRTAYLQPAHVMASPDIIGQVLPVTIDSLERYSLIGKLAGHTPIAASRFSARHDHRSLKPLPKSASDSPTLAPQPQARRQTPHEAQIVVASTTMGPPQPWSALRTKSR